jgi:hypothetical protein
MSLEGLQWCYPPSNYLLQELQCFPKIKWIAIIGLQVNLMEKDLLSIRRKK